MALGLSLALLLTACSGEKEQQDSETPSAETTPYLDVPDGTDLTAPGTELSLGDSATVAFPLKQDVVGVVEMAVTRIDRGRVKDLAGFKLDERTRKSTPYYVRVKVTQAGDTKVAGAMPPLYVADGENRLIPATRFTSAFAPCPSRPLPKSLAQGSSATACWVYLLPQDGSLESMSFYPTDGFDPIVWTGKVTSPKKDAKKADKKGQKKPGKKRSKKR